MTFKTIQLLAQKYQLSEHIIVSWIETANLNTHKKAEAFFAEHIEAIKASPLVKWVGGKRQLLPVLTKLFPKKFNNYFEPFL